MPVAIVVALGVALFAALVCFAIVSRRAADEEAVVEPIDPNEKRIYFKWNGKRYSVPRMVFVQGRYVVLPNRTVLRIRAWLLNSDIIPTDIVEVTERGARKNAVRAIEEPDEQS